MTSSGLEPPTHTTGAHRARRGAPRLPAHPSPRRPPARYEPHLDGLFTYCLSVLCDHDAATEALGGVLAIAERQDGRCPAGEEERKSWLYALARWMCLRKLAEQKQGRQAHSHKAGKQPRRLSPKQEAKRAGGPPGKQPGTAAAQGARAGRRTPPVVAAKTAAAPGGAPAGPARAPETETEAAAEAHRRELAQLAWPEAAGTTPEQREALELAVRHHLPPRAVASVLGLEPATARELLAAAACEVERTRAALAVVETGNCPTVARLTGEHRVLLSAALRRELVRHVDDCPRCRRAAERAGAKGPWPGAAVTAAAALPVVEAPRPSAYVAMVHAQRNRSGGPRFDRTGFPMDPKDHAARRDRLRARVVTTTVVATVVAAPVIALWTAYRGAPQTGEGHEGSSVTATESDARHELDGTADGHYENAGNARPQPGARFADDRAPDVSAEVISAGPGRGGAAGLTVEARSSGGRTLLRLTASGGAPVAWSARPDASWVRLSRYSGTLAAGESITIHVRVNHWREPAGPWSARIALAPSGSAVVIRGRGAPPSSDGPGRPFPADPSVTTGPSAPPTSSPDPTPSTDPTPGPSDPTPTPTAPSPDPTASTDPTPTDEPGPGTTPTG
ncbi:BACON domain-containing protein [Streptomyces sp. NPDC001966]